MIPIKQEFHRLREDYDRSTMIGDCWRATIASLLELPLHAVPHFAKIWEDESSHKAMNVYYSFMLNHGYGIRPVNISDINCTPKFCKIPIFKNESEYYFVSVEYFLITFFMIWVKIGFKIVDILPTLI